jgi:hypothetical protein
MQFNWDDVRLILRQVEALPHEDSELDSDQVVGVDGPVAAYLMRRLMEGGYLVGESRQLVGAPASCVANHMTMAGHQLWADIKRDTVWNKVKDAAKRKGVELSISVIKELAAAAIKSLLHG